MKSLPNKKGFGLIELSIALAVAAIIGFVVIRGYSNAQDSKNAQGIIKDIGIVHSTIKTVYGTQRDYMNANISGIKTSLPKSMIENIGVDYIKTSGGGFMTLGAAQMNNTVGIQDVIGYTIMAVDDNVCSKLITSDMGRELVAIGANGEVRGLPQTGGGTPTFTPAEAGTICSWGNQNSSNGGAGNQVSIYMK